MSRQRIHRPEEKTEINISPMIDMVFILLIFFIVTTVFVEEEGMSVEKPTPSSEIQQQKRDEPVMIRVTISNQLIHDGNIISLSRVESLVRTALSQADVPVILQVERGALAGMMIQVMDRAKLGGATKISVSSVDPK